MADDQAGSLLEQFLVQECTPYVRRLLQDVIADAAGSSAHFELNRFEVTIDRESSTASFQDVLDATEAGIQRVPLAELIEALSR